MSFPSENNFSDFFDGNGKCRECGYRAASIDDGLRHIKSILEKPEPKFTADQEFIGCFADEEEGHFLFLKLQILGSYYGGVHKNEVGYQVKTSEIIELEDQPIDKNNIIIADGTIKIELGSEFSISEEYLIESIELYNWQREFKEM